MIAKSFVVILPTYNERENVRTLIQQILSVVSDAKILVVDDASPDGTGAIADELSRSDSRISVLHRSSKQGLASAYISGITWANAQGFEYIVQMDADGSHRPEDIPLLLQALEHSDVAIGSRNVQNGGTDGWSIIRRSISKLGGYFALRMLNLPVTDCTSGFRAFRKTVFERINLANIRSQGFSFQIEIAYYCCMSGLIVSEMPIIFVDRKRGRSKFTIDIILEAFLLVIFLRRMKRLNNRDTHVFSG